MSPLTSAGTVAAAVDAALIDSDPGTPPGEREVIIGTGLASSAVIERIRSFTGLDAGTARTWAVKGGTITGLSAADAATIRASLTAAGRHSRVAITELAPSTAPRVIRSRRARPEPKRKHLLHPAGPQTRPNGEIYQPRELGGLEDVALFRDAQVHGESILMNGPPGTGKTALAEAAFAGPDGSGLETIVVQPDTTTENFIGDFIQDAATGRYNWVDGPLLRSLANGVPFFVDEIGFADAGILTVLHSLMDGRGVLNVTSNPEIGTVEARPGWMLIGAWNPDEPGARLPGAMRSRFSHHFKATTDWDLAAELGVSEAVLAVFRNLDKRRDAGELTWSPQMREAQQYVRMAERFGERYAAASVAAKAEGPDATEITEALRTVFPGLRPLETGARYGK